MAGFAGCLPLVLAVGLLLAAAMPVAADPSDYLVEASMLVSRSEASAEDVLTFWISIDRLGAKARYLTIRETMPVGLALISTAEPSSCAVTNGTWLCDQRDRTPFVIEVQTIVQPGSEDQRLVNVARIEVLYHEEVRAFIEVSAGVLVVPESEVGEPDLSVRVSVAQGAVMPGSDLNYRINVTNNGTAPATNVSIVVSMPTVMVLLSASPLPMAQDGGLRWTVESLPVCSLEILFNLTLPMALELDHVQVAVAATYGDGNGDDVRVEGLPLSLSVVPAAPPGSMVPVGILVAVVAFIGGGLLVAQRTVGLPLVGRSGAEEIFLLHRSGLVLKHFSAHPSAEADSDIVGGMMAAVRMFVEDSMSPYAGHLREIRFGGGSIVFVNGENVTLAAVNAKGGTARFAERAMHFLREFERTNGAALTNFDGVDGGLEGVDALFRRFARRPGGGPELPVGPPREDVPRQ